MPPGESARQAPIPRTLHGRVACGSPSGTVTTARKRPRLRIASPKRSFSSGSPTVTRSAAGRCVLCGRALCEDCDRGRRPYHLCEQHANVPMIEGWAELLSLSEEFEARLIEENLRAEGIDARILDQKDHSAFPVDIGDLARIRILVEPAEYARAERIISAHSDAAGEVSFGCPHCGEPYDEGEKVCGSCGEALV